MRNTIEKNIIAIANKIKFDGLYKTIQYILYGNSKNVCPKGCKW